MIVFELICARHHRFEGWFASSADFNVQKERGLLSCPVCGEKSIEKLLTAKIGHAESNVPGPGHKTPEPRVPLASGTSLQMKLHEILDYVLTHSDDVGSSFASEARKMHYQQAPRRDIRGTASAEQAEELIDEGIPVYPLPIPPQGDWH